ncbi:MAG: Zn-dependent hydrolase [Caldilineaceae bacterium]|nr:Zn-dependent hydrolase [Caldilineaceae bacterium]
MNSPRINGERLWDSLMRMSSIGATPKGGVCRLALTDLDRQGRELFVRWCKAAGCSVAVDRLGSIFARRAGLNPELPPVLLGSHLDSQPTGGKFDGAFGVLAGLEVVRTLNDSNLHTEAPIEIVSWTNEEGVRFGPPMLASGAFAGTFDLDFVLSRADADGKTLGDELERIGYAGARSVRGHEVAAYLEPHIEQGPILEREQKTIGVVTGAQGQRWYEVTVTGMEAHAGPTPMGMRHDALVGAARMVEAVHRMGLGHPDARATVGKMQVHPGSPNTVPGRVFFTVDLRHPDEEYLTLMDARLKADCAIATEDLGLQLQLEQIWHFAATPFHEECIAAVRNAAAGNAFAHMDLVSGAGHDACYVAQVSPTAMIFVPCKDGISHNEIESATPEDLAAGCQVLFDAAVHLAGPARETTTGERHAI